MTTTSIALSTLVRIMSPFPGYEPDGWELDGQTTIAESELEFYGNCVIYQGRCFVDDGSTLVFKEWLF